MIDVKFKRNRRSTASKIKFENFQGMNCVDNNSVLPAHQVPFAFNTDFGRQIGAAAKRFGLESQIATTVDAYKTSFTYTLAATASAGQVFTTGAGVTNIAEMLFRDDGLSDLSKMTVTVWDSPSKSTQIGVATALFRFVSQYVIKARFTPSLTVTAATQYYVEISSSAAFNIKAGGNVSSTGLCYLDGVLTNTRDLYYSVYRDTLGATGVISQHCFRSSAGDIPLIAHGTDLYKLSGASTTRTTDTEAEFNAGTLTDVVVFSDVETPASAPTIGTGGGTGLTGDYYGKVTYVAADGSESAASSASAKFTASNQNVYWTNIPTGGAGVVQRKLYRTKAGGTIYYYVATIDENTSTAYIEAVADSSLTVAYADKRVVLGPGDTKGAAVITQNQTTSLVAIKVSAGQTITIPAGIRKIYSIAPYLTELGAGESVTLTLYSGVDKAATIGTATLAGAVSDGYMEFVLNVAVTPGAVYYYEIVKNAGTAVRHYYSNIPSIYTGGEMYQDGVAAGVDMAFIIYGCKYALTGTYESEVIDLTTAPTQATLTFSQTLNGQTVAWFAKCSSDNVVWGDYQAVILSGDGMPLGRYIKIKAVLGSDGSATPSVTDYMISYNTGFGTATSIKGSLSGSKIRFTDWDDRVWFCDGVKNWVYDGGFVIAPETVPTIAASGSGTITGVYNCKVAYVNSDGTEGLPCTAVEVTASSSLRFDWSGIPATLGYTRKLYRTKAGGSIYYFVATLNSTDTTYTDTTADASLTTAIEVHTGHNVIEIGLSPAVDCTKPPASTIIHIHKNYAFYVEASTGRVYVAKVNDPHSIPTASYFSFPSMPLSFKTYGDYLIVSGKDYTWYSSGEIWDVDPAVGDWSWKVVSSTIGCISHEGMIESLDGADNEIVIFPLATGIKYLNANLMGTDLHSVPLSRNVQPYFDQAISREKMSAIFWDQAYYIAFNWSDPTTTADNHNNAVFKLDLRNREWSGLWGMDITGFFVANNELYMTSSTCGRVYKHAGSDDDGEAIDMIVDSSYVGDAYDKRRFTKAVARIKKGCDTTSSTLLVRCDNTERTITLGANTAWAGAGGSSRTVQDEIVSPPRTISGGRAHNVGWRFEDNTVNDMVLYGITIMAEPIS